MFLLRAKILLFIRIRPYPIRKKTHKAFHRLTCSQDETGIILKLTLFFWKGDDFSLFFHTFEKYFSRYSMSKCTQDFWNTLQSIIWVIVCVVKHMKVKVNSSFQFQVNFNERIFTTLKMKILYNQVLLWTVLNLIILDALLIQLDSNLHRKNPFVIF